MAESKKRESYKAWYAIIGLIILLSFFAPSILNVIRNYGAELSGKILLEMVKQESNNYYTIEYDDANLGLFKRHLVIHNFRIVPDSSATATGDQEQPINSFQINIPTLEIKLETFYEIFLFRELKVESVKIVDPEVMMVRTANDGKRRPFSMEAGDLYAIISQYLKLFKIDYFQIQDAAFSFQKEEQQSDSSSLDISDFDILVENFSIDSASNEAKKVFFTDAIELVINDQILYLSDSIHRCSFDRLILSTNSQLIQFDGIKVSPRKDLNMSFFKNPEGINIYDIKVPRLQLRGVDFLDAYFNNRLNIEHIDIFQPEVRIDDRIVATEKNEATNSLGAILTQYFDEVSIGRIALERGLVDLKILKDRRGRRVRLENANIALKKFRVDTSFFKGDMKTNFFEEIDISFDHYALNLPDSMHSVYVKDFMLSSERQILRMDSIRVSPRQQMRPRGKPIYHVYLPMVKVKGFDWATITSERQFVFDTFDLPSPQIAITLHQKDKTGSQGGFSPKERARALLESIDQLAFQYANISNGNLHLKDDEEELLGFESIDLQLEQFDINKNNVETNADHFYAKGIDLTFKDFDVEIANRTQMIFLDEFNYSTYKDLINISGFRIKPVNRQPAHKKFTMNGTVRNILLRGIMINEMLDQNHFQFEHLLIDRPAVDLIENEYYDAKAVKEKTEPLEWLKYLSIEDFKLQNGRFRLAGGDSIMLNIGNADASVANLSLDSLQVRQNHWQHNMQKLNMSVGNITWLMEKQEHQIEIDRIDINQQEKLLDLQGVTFSPQANRNPDPSLHFNTPDLAFRGIDLEEIFFDRILEVDTILFQKSTLDFKQVNPKESLANQSSNRQMESLRNRILEQFKWIDVDHLLMDSSSLSFELPDAALKIPQAVFHIDAFVVNENKDDAKVFFADNYTFEFDDVSMTAKQGRDSVSITEFRWDTGMERIMIDSLQLISQASDTNQLPLSFQFDNLLIHGFDPEEFYNNQNVSANYLRATQPKLAISKKSRSKESTPIPMKFKVPPNGPQKVSFDSIQLDQVGVKIFDPAIEDTAAYSFKDVDILLTDFQWDSTKRLDERGLIFSDNIHISGRKFSYLLSDSLFRINADTYQADTRSGDIVITELEIEPTLEQYALGEYVGHQTDWIHGIIDTLKLDSLNLKSALYEQTLDLNALYVNHFKFLIFRDKRLPFPEDQYKMLPHLALQEVEMPIMIDTINLMNGHLEYQEFAEGASEPGKISFEALNAQIKNVTNQDVTLAANPIMELNASTKVMGEAKVYLNSYADMTDPKGKFLMDGKVESFPIDVLNPMMEHVAFVKVRSGRTDRISFELEADDEYSLGEMKFFYKDLKINLVSKKNESEKGMGPALGSFFANTFIVNSNNPNFLFVRNGDIYFERDKQRSIFNYWSKSFLSGVVSSIGAKSNKKDIRKKNKEALKRLKEEQKEDRVVNERMEINE